MRALQLTMGKEMPCPTTHEKSVLIAQFRTSGLHPTTTTSNSSSVIITTEHNDRFISRAIQPDDHGHAPGIDP